MSHYGVVFTHDPYCSAMASLIHGPRYGCDKRKRESQDSVKRIENSDLMPDVFSFLG